MMSNRSLVTGWNDLMPWRRRGASATIVVVVMVVALLSGCGDEGTRQKRHAGNAEQYFNSGDYNRAEIEYKNLLQADADNVHANRRMGTIWLERGSPQMAVRFLTKAAGLDPGNSDLRMQLATALLALGERSAARDEAMVVLKTAPASGQALMMLAMTASDDGEIKDTAERLESLRDSGDAAVHVATAIVAMRRKDLKAAESALDRALALDARYSRAHVWKGAWHQAQGRTEEVGRCLQAAVALAPRRSLERVEYASFLMAAGNREAAMDFLRETVNTTPDFLPAWRMLARDAMARNAHDETDGLLARVFALDAVDYEASLLQCEAWLARRDAKMTGKAVDMMRRLGKIHPASPVVAVSLAKAHLAEGKDASAVEVLDRALIQTPDFRDAVLLREELKLRDGRAVEVSAVMEEWLAKHPGDANARLILAEAYRLQNRLDLTLENYKSLAATPGADSQCHLRLGHAFLQLGRPEDARKSFFMAQELDPSSLPAALELVKLDLQAKDFESALRHAENQRKLHPESALPRHLRAMVLVRQSKWNEAEEDLKAALRIDPGMVTAYQMLVGTYFATGKTADAIEQLKQVRKIDPGNIPALMTLGAIHEGSQRKAEARECYEEILKRDKEFVPALNNLAILLGESSGEDLDRARKLATQARVAKPGEAAIADTLGWILFKLGEFKRSRELLGGAAEGIPDNPVVLYHFGMACRAMGDAQAAREALRGALGTGIAFPEKPETVRVLEQLDRTLPPGEEGIRELREHIRVDPSDVIARMSLAGRLEEAGRNEESAAAYADALAVNPQLHGAVSRLAGYYAGPLNDGKKALDYARRARELEPGDAQAAAILATLAFRAGEYERADNLFVESLAKIKDDAGLMIQGAWAAYSVGRVADAGKLMEAAIASAKDSTAVAGAKRFLEFQKQDCSAEEIRTALAADPDYVPALMARAAFAEKDKQTPAALEDYGRVLRIYPKFQPARDGIARIQPEETPDS